MFEYDADEVKDTPQFNCLPAGEYEAEIMSAECKTSSKGNEMLVVNYKLFGDSDDERIGYATDYMVTGSTLYKLKQLCGCVGMDFGAGEIDESDLVGKILRVAVKIEVPKDPKYSERNVVTKYIAAEQKTEITDDDVPF